MLEPKEKELARITEEAVNYLDRIEKLNKDLENAENTYYSIKGELDNAKARIKELEDAHKWHYTSKKDYPTLDGEYQVIVESHNHPGVYITTVYNWDSDLESFADSCYPENVVTWAELLPQPDNLEDEINS